MNLKQLKIAIFGLVSILIVPVHANADEGKTYSVTITNLTAGQPFTPPVLLTHSSRTSIFAVAEAASEDIQQIAENGNRDPLLATLANDVNVHQVVKGAAPLVPANFVPNDPGFEYSATYEITAKGQAKYLSFASMLICTNDGFTGLNSVELPKKQKTVYSVAYDARTEMNTEDFANMVPPCQGLIGVSSDDMGTGASDPSLAESGVVIPHVGITGGADLLPKVHGWGDPVAKIEIRRVRNDRD